MQQVRLYLDAIDRLDARRRAAGICDTNLAFAGDEKSIKKTLKVLHGD